MHGFQVSRPCVSIDLWSMLGSCLRGCRVPVVGTRYNVDSAWSDGSLKVMVANGTIAYRASLQNSCRHQGRILHNVPLHIGTRIHMYLIPT